MWPSFASYVCAAVAGAAFAVLQLTLSLGWQCLWRRFAALWTAAYTALYALFGAFGWYLFEVTDFENALGIGMPILCGILFPEIVLNRLASFSVPGGKDAQQQALKLYGNIVWLFKQQIVHCNAKNLYRLSLKLHWSRTDNLRKAVRIMLAIEQFWRDPNQRKDVEERLGDMDQVELIKTILMNGMASEVAEMIDPKVRIVDATTDRSVTTIRKFLMEQSLDAEAEQLRNTMLSDLPTDENKCRKYLIEFILNYCGSDTWERLKTYRETPEESAREDGS